MIWGRLVERDSQEFLKRYSVVDLGFQFGIGIDAEPLLEKETFEEEKRGIGFIPFVTFSDGIISHKDSINSGPIYDGIDLLHPVDGAIMLKGVEKGDIGKREVGIGFFEAHSSSGAIDFKGL